jgi:hypothetical protein
MKVKLIDIDNPKLGNLALMKISAWHKRQGDEVGFDISDPDKVYISCFFKWNKPLALGIAKMFDCEVEVGGYGINSMKLPDEVEHIMPDYSLYGIQYSMKLCELGVDPFVMRYDRRGDRRDREFSRWVNRRWYKSFSFDKWLEIRFLDRIGFKAVKNDDKIMS